MRTQAQIQIQIQIRAKFLPLSLYFLYLTPQIPAERNLISLFK